jgi:WD40 repeat protein/beta-lactamase regulating signal transducer with metallopeptidase domain
MTLFNSSDSIAAAVAWIVLVVVQVTVAAAAGLLAAAFVRRDPASRHAVLCIALVALCVSPCGAWLLEQSRWNGIPIPFAYRASSSEPPIAHRAVGDAPAPVRNPVGRQSTQDLDANRESFARAIIADADSSRVVRETAGPAAAESASRAEVARPAAGPSWKPFGRSALFVGVAVWMFGLLVLCARMVHGWLAVGRMCRDAIPLDRARFAGLIGSVEQRFGLRRPLRIVVSQRIGTAAAAGWLHQQIVLPASYVARLSPEELETVLIHETAHLVRRDHWIALLQRVAAAVYWPHPLVHLLNRRLARAREECCDNYVLKQFDRGRYAQLLLRLAEWPAGWMPPAPTLAFFNRRWKLEDRITGLLDGRRQSAVRPRRSLVLVAGTAIGVIALASAGLRFTQASDKPATADGSQPPTGTVSATAQTTEKNPSHPAAAVTVKEPVAAAGALPPPRRDLPGHASVQLGNLRFRTQASDLAFLPDGKTIISASWRDGINYWDVATGNLRLHVAAKADKMRMTADRKRLVTQDTYNREQTSLQVWDAADGKHVADIKCRTNPFAFEVLQAVTADGTAAILSDQEGQIRIRDLANGRVLRERAMSPREVEHITVSPNGALLAIASDSNELFLWEWQSTNPPVVLGPHRRYEGLAFSADGKRLAAGADTRDEVLIFNVATHEIEQSLTDPKGWPLLVGDLAFTPDGKWLAAANWIGLTHDFTAGILVWDVETGALKHRFTVSGAQPRRLALTPDGNLLAAPMGETLHVWNLQTGQTVGRETTGHTAIVCALHFSPRGERIVTASDDCTARIWDVVTGRELHRLHHGKWVRATTVSPDGTLIATSGLDDKVRIWQMETGKQVHALQGHGVVGGWRALQFSPDGSVLYSWGDDYNLRVWDVATGQLKRAFALKRSGTLDADGIRKQTLPHRAEFEQRCRGVCFRDGGKQLVLAARNRYWIFDTATGRETGAQKTKTELNAMACSETGGRILMSHSAPFRSRQVPSGGWRSEPVGTGRLSLLALGTGSPVWSTAVNGIFVNPIAVSPDGRFAAAGMGGLEHSSIGLFDSKNGSLLKTIEGTGPLGGSHREAAFSSDGNRLAVAQKNGTVLIWDLAWLGVKSR